MLSMKSGRYIGVMSGTSLDGVDVVGGEKRLLDKLADLAHVWGRRQDQLAVVA